jgi:transposase InsO family protein
VWNRIPDDVRRQIVELALEWPELSPRELAVTFTDTKGYFVSEASVYRLLSDNGASYIAGDLADWLEGQGINHVRGAPYHPQTQGKIERWHQTLKNRILLENYYLPGDLENQIQAFVDHYNHRRYHESLGNLTPADVYFRRDTAIIKRREKIKKRTFEKRRLDHQRQAA